MAPSAISTPTGIQETSWAHSNGIPEPDQNFENLHISPPTSQFHSNGFTNGHTSPSSSPSSPTSAPSTSTSTPPADEVLDVICIGFGPASLAIAIAINDAYSSNDPRDTSHTQTFPSTLFLEKQPHFAWHAGMQLPGAKMQISFLKDLATPRDPTSKFTFLNYLFSVGRLNHFINLATFLPTRLEYEDYLRWCAAHFEQEGRVRYGTEVEGVKVAERGIDGKAVSFEVSARGSDGEKRTWKARRVVIAVGGRPVIPVNLRGLKCVAHSSQFSNRIEAIAEKEGLGERERRLRFAVVGSGQSAAEIFNELWDRFPDAEVRLIIRGASLRPSDDSPFVNEVFDPDRVNGIYAQHPVERATGIALDRATNYGVVRLTLLEHLYEKIYMQRLTDSDESKWRCRILPNRAIVSATQCSKNSDSGIRLKLGAPEEKREWINDAEKQEEEELEVDYVFTATGYARNAHEEMLASLNELLPNELKEVGKEKKKPLPVSRDYRVMYDEEKVDYRQAGVWLQGCNESTHGLSDTLLSILAVRGGELVESMFGKQMMKP